MIRTADALQRFEHQVAGIVPARLGFGGDQIRSLLDGRRGNFDIGHDVGRGIVLSVGSVGKKQRQCHADQAGTRKNSHGVAPDNLSVVDSTRSPTVSPIPA